MVLNMMRDIQRLIKDNKLEDAIHGVIDGSKKIERVVSEYLWSQQRLQDLILRESKGELMHWNHLYDRIAYVDDLNSPWFYRDEEGCFYNVTEDHLSELLIRIELMTQSE